MLFAARRVSRALVLLACAAALLVFPSSTRARSPLDTGLGAFLPLVLAPAAAPRPVPPAALTSDWISRVNYYRALAGAPPVSDDPRLSESCRERARVLVENASALAGESCVVNGAAWVSQGARQPFASLADWMASAEQRQWLLYPTTPAFGYGSFADATHSAAAIDTRSALNDGADASFTGWPLRYPGDGQIGVLPDRAPITLLWRRAGPAPQIDTTVLRTENGTPVAHGVAPLPGGHQGVQLIPLADLPERTVLFVEVYGIYDGVPFALHWQFATGEPEDQGFGAPNPIPSLPQPPA